METLLEKGYPFPPFELNGSINSSSPLFYTPTTLVLFIAVIGSSRYFSTKNIPWQDISSPLAPRQKRLSALSKLIIVLSCAVTFSFIFDTIVVLARVFLEQGALSVTLLYYIGVSWVAWAAAILCLLDESHKFSKWYWVQYAFFAFAALGETCVGWVWTVGVYKPRPGTIYSIYDKFSLAIFTIRYIIEIAVFLLSIIQLLTTTRHIENRSETSPLLGQQSNYGATEPITTAPKTKESGAGFWSKLKRVMPFIWPHKNIKLQQLVVVCFLLMCLGLTVNVYTPLQIGRVVDQFNREPQSFAWAAVCIYVGFKFLQGGSGLIQAMQNYLWIPVGQFTTREISVKLFAHLHSLSLHYHINRKTGEVLRTVDRGTNSIVQLLSQIVFSIFPALANILIAVVVFSVKFSIPFGLIVFVTMAVYLYITITLSEWRTGFRRKMNELDNYARSKAVDSLLNFETVKYYNAESFEINRYDNAIVDYQKADFINSVSLNVLNLAQNAVITAGLLAGSLLFAYEVSQGTLTPGDFVSFNIYMMQLYTPLHFFGTYYRMIQQNFIDMEKMFDLFDVEASVKDAEDATELHVSEGYVKFDHVSFSYDQRQTALNDISFTIPRGATVALVGPSGGGKSTILRLLFRFYDPDAGHIYIDGQDIAKVKQTSLRKNIGVVPQDTVLFNDTIKYNIGYGRVEGATDEDVFRAAKAAQIHEKILTFPEGYETKVGERGLRLSGGEKQRVAIARTILKDPSIILLDEATSALDTTTERYIQEALADMTKGRTTLVIAHRLSTIVNADLILVVKGGQIVESGSHDELIQNALAGNNEGIYYDMWQKQLDDHHESSLTASGTLSLKDEPTVAVEPEVKKDEPEDPIVEEPETIEVKEEEEAQGVNTNDEGEEANTTNTEEDETASSSDDKKNVDGMTPVETPSRSNTMSSTQSRRNRRKKKKNRR